MCLGRGAIFTVLCIIRSVNLFCLKVRMNGFVCFSFFRGWWWGGEIGWGWRFVEGGTMSTLVF